MTRQCGDCQLCCKLLPMKQGADEEFKPMRDELFKRGLIDASAYRSSPDFNKPAGEKCPHQKHGCGCKIYPLRPLGCRFWQCRWLAEEDTADLRRPDRSHYVIDMAPDFVTTSEGGTIPVLQVWVDAGFRNAHRDPALRRYLIRRQEKDGYAALIRWNNREDCMFLVYVGNGKWIEKITHLNFQREHTSVEKAIALERMEIPYDLK